MAVGIALIVICAALIVALFVLQRRQADEHDPVAGSSPPPRASTPDPPREEPKTRQEPDKPRASADSNLQASAEALFRDEGGGDADVAVDEGAESTPPTRGAPSDPVQPSATGPAVTGPAVTGPAAKESSPSSATSAKRHWLVGVTKRIKGKTFHIGDKTATIGRLPNNFVQLDDGDVSRVHCQLRPRGDSLQIMPMETKNGTRVNGEVAQPHELYTLEDGDYLEVGNSVLAYHESADFEGNDAEAKKSRGITVEMATAMVGGDRWSKRIQTELTAHGGDVDKTARTLGIEPDVLRHMIDQLGVANV